MEKSNRIQMKCPWNLDSYFGRWMYYSWITNPKLSFVSAATIEEAKILRLSRVFLKVNPMHLTMIGRHGPTANEAIELNILYAKQIYENAIHPDTVEVKNMFGRLSFLPIGKALVVASLLTQFTNNSSCYIFHGINQSYDSFVNFTNRNGDTQLNQISRTGLGLTFLAASASSTIVAIYVERFLVSKICHPLLYRFIPMSAFIAANIINVPIMRHREITEGVGIYDCHNNKIGYSKFVAVIGIGKTIVTRMIMFAPGIVIMQYLEDVLDSQSCWFRKNKWAHFPFKSIGYGLFLIGMVPTACAIFPQFSSVQLSTLKKCDDEAYSQITKNCSQMPDRVYFNKGT